MEGEKRDKGVYSLGAPVCSGRGREPREGERAQGTGKEALAASLPGADTNSLAHKTRQKQPLRPVLHHIASLTLCAG